jgi:hypothetical protein
MSSILARLTGAIAFAGSALAPAGVAAQDPMAPPALCGVTPCALLFDWGPGKSSGDYGADLRYGSADDFEAAVRRVLLARGVRLAAGSSSSQLTLTLRPKLDTRAMCETMPGTNTSYRCTAMSEIAIVFASSDSLVKAPATSRWSNRCGGVGTYMTMPQFGQYIGEMIWWTMNGAALKEKRPALRC